MPNTHQAKIQWATRCTMFAVTRKAGSWPRDAMTYVKELPATGSSVDHCIQCRQSRASRDVFTVYFSLEANLMANFWARDATLVDRDAQELHILAVWLRGGCRNIESTSE